MVETSTVSDKLKDPEEVTWEDLGLVDTLCEVCRSLKWAKPTKIQREAIPPALQGKDIIGLAETGSGKTAAFALPILQGLLENPQKFYALIISPTRELAMQIHDQFEALGGSMGVRCVKIFGGMDMINQALMLAKKPHIIVTTPGRLVDHLKNTKGFNLRTLKYLVLDEADRILGADFERELNEILKVIPRDRKTSLFSATMTKKVKKLQRASLRNPVKVEVSSKYQTVANLKQHYIFCPAKFKDIYLIYILSQMSGDSFMIFCDRCDQTSKTAILLQMLGFKAIPLHGQMTQNKRIAALAKFKAKEKNILVSTDVASRGLDIPHVDVVINFEMPTNSKDYIHRVGRTARAGRSGVAITFVNQYDIELYQRIEELLGKKLDEYPTEEDEVMTLQERVAEAQREVKKKLKEIEDKKMSKRTKRGQDEDDEEDDTEQSSGVRKRFKGKSMRGKRR
ncbi:probable ATP-dependent RNA helicase DDX47 [Copidosoma floridanum]|uniref:probable ATP-dependent RNA helicase DDX47 n=1 Tax=Copidosoma floridanum TaxID=29053 RepID=UPI0006C9C789|nr:probable ATP-dependent RNA helicase DDX47 [Copidosoma floridanum]